MMDTHAPMGIANDQTTGDDAKGNLSLANVLNYSTTRDYLSHLTCNVQRCLPMHPSWQLVRTRASNGERHTNKTIPLHEAHR
jgi:hypothetical protein